MTVCDPLWDTSCTLQTMVAPTPAGKTFYGLLAALVVVIGLGWTWWLDREEEEEEEDEW